MDPTRERSPARSETDILRHHDDESFLDALELLISSGKARTTADLVRYAERANEPAVADFLRPHAADDLPVQLAFEALRVHLRIVAHKRDHTLLKDVAGRAIGLVLPLPPHILDAFLALPKVTLLVPDGHHLPPHLRGLSNKAQQGSRACRNSAPACQVLVFEVHRDGDQFTVEPGVSDVVDLRIVPPETELLVHVRPHPHPNDVPFVLGRHSLKIL